MMHGNIARGDTLIIYNKESKLKPIRAQAQEGKPDDLSGYATLNVGLYHDNVLGVYEMTINVNDWDVYLADSDEGRKFMLDYYLPLPLR